MSVLKRKRKQSQMEYVKNAYNIESRAFDFVKRLSVQNQRLLQNPTCKLASFQADCAYMANEIYPTCELEYQIRRALLALSKSALHALDKRMSDVYSILLENPKGVFCRKNGKSVSASDAEGILNRMAEEMGYMIDDQERMLKGVRDKDRTKFSKLRDSPLSESVKEMMKSFLNSAIFQMLD